MVGQQPRQRLWVGTAKKVYWDTENNRLTHNKQTFCYVAFGTAPTLVFLITTGKQFLRQMLPIGHLVASSSDVIGLEGLWSGTILQFTSAKPITSSSQQIRTDLLPERADSGV